MSTPKPTIPIQPIDFDAAKRVVEDFAAERNVPSQSFPRDAKGEGSGTPTQPERSPTRKLTVELPDYVIDAILTKALQSRPKGTARFVVLEALQAIGIEVKAADRVRDGRRSEGGQTS